MNQYFKIKYINERKRQLSINFDKMSDADIDVKNEKNVQIGHTKFDAKGNENINECKVIFDDIGYNVPDQPKIIDFDD